MGTKSLIGHCSNSLGAAVLKCSAVSSAWSRNKFKLTDATADKRQTCISVMVSGRLDRKNKDVNVVMVLRSQTKNHALDHCFPFKGLAGMLTPQGFFVVTLL
jgi:hypothetical protein